MTKLIVIFCGFTNAPTKQHKEIKNYSKENFEKCCVICWRQAVTAIVTTQRITVGVAAKFSIFSISSAP
jgi:hypothetical protein